MGLFDWIRFFAFIRFSESKMKTCSVSAAVLNGFVAPTPRRSVANVTETKRRTDLAVMSVMVEPLMWRGQCQGQNPLDHPRIAEAHFHGRLGKLILALKIWIRVGFQDHYLSLRCDPEIDPAVATNA